MIYDYCLYMKPGVPTCVKKGVAHDHSRDKKMTLCYQGHFTHFTPISRWIKEKPVWKYHFYYYPFRGIFSILYPISREVKDKILREKNCSH